MRKLLGLLVAAVVLTAVSGAAYAQTKFQAEVTFISTGTSFGVMMYKMVGNAPAGGDATTTKIVWDGKFGAPTKGAAAWINSDVYVKFNAGIEISTSSVVRFYTDNKNATGTYKYNAALPAASAKAMAALDANNNALVEPGLPISYMVTASTTITNVGSLFLGTSGPSHEFGFGVWAVKDIFEADYNTAAFGVNAEYSTIATSDGIRLGYGNTGAGEPPVFYDYPSTDVHMFFASTFETAKANRKYGTDSLTFEVQNP